MQENLRNIGNAEGELQPRFATPENLQSEQRSVSRDLKECIVDQYSGLLAEFSDCFSGANLKSCNVDKTGKSAKILYKAKVEYVARATDSGDGQKIDHRFNKTVFVNIGVPSTVSFGTEDRLPPKYSSPAIAEADFAVQGGYNDRAGQKSFMNRFSLISSSYFTAAAMEMAYLYMTYFLLPRLNGTASGFRIGAIPDAGRNSNPTSSQTSMLPSELTSHHSLSVISLLYTAMQSNVVLNSVGYDTNEVRVFNKCGDLPETDIDEEIFFEAWHVLKHSAIGSSGSKQWDMDFLLLIIQNFPLHAVTDEGGIWRKMFSNVGVAPNAGVITSKFKSNTEGFHNINDRMIVCSGAVVQMVVSRALFETEFSNHRYMLAPSSEPSEVAKILNMCKDSIITALFSATNISLSYWDEVIGIGSPQDLQHDRHILVDNAMFLKGFSPFIPTYSLTIEGDRLGRCEYNKDSCAPLRFKGDYSTKVGSMDNNYYFLYDMQSGMNFTNGLFYMNPKVNYDDGIMDMTNEGVITGSTRPLEANVQLVDGREFKHGDSIADIIWADNNDVIPSQGDLTSVGVATVLLSMGSTESWVMSGTYTVSVTRYSACVKQKGESDRPGKSRADVYLEIGGRKYSHVFQDRPKIIDTRKYYTHWKNFTSKKAKRRAEFDAKARIRLLTQTTGQDISYFTNVDMDDLMLQLRERTLKEIAETLEVMGSVRRAVDNSNYYFTKQEVKDFKKLKKKPGSGIEFHLLSHEEVDNLKKETDGGKVAIGQFGFSEHRKEWDEEEAVKELEGLQVILNANLLDSVANLERCAVALGLSKDVEEILSPVNYVIDNFNAERDYVTDEVKYTSKASSFRSVPSAVKSDNKKVSLLFKDVGTSKKEAHEPAKSEPSVSPAEKAEIERLNKRLDEIEVKYGPVGRSVFRELDQFRKDALSKAKSIKEFNDQTCALNYVKSDKFEKVRANTLKSMINDGFHVTDRVMETAEIIKVLEGISTQNKLNEDWLNQSMEELKSNQRFNLPLGELTDKEKDYIRSNFSAEQLEGVDIDFKYKQTIREEHNDEGEVEAQQDELVDEKDVGD